MKLASLLILTFCAHQVFGQENVSDSAKTSRRLQDDGSINSYNRQLVAVEDTPDEFIIKRPSKNDAAYNDYLNYLYRRDKAKSKSKREIASEKLLSDITSRNKRMIIFRPLFVYKQQEVKRQRVVDDKNKKKKPTKKPSKQG